MDAKRIPFTEEDERRIGSAATWGMVVSITSIATALLSVAVTGEQVAAMVQLAGLWAAAPFIQALLTILFDVWLLQASLAFRKVAITDEADQAHLLAGFRKLRAYFMVQVILIILAVVGGLIFAVIM